jgi:hypothetical protein
MPRDRKLVQLFGGNGLVHDTGRDKKAQVCSNCVCYVSVDPPDIKFETTSRDPANAYSNPALLIDLMLCRLFY